MNCQLYQAECTYTPRKTTRATHHDGARRRKGRPVTDKVPATTIHQDSPPHTQSPRLQPPAAIDDSEPPVQVADTWGLGHSDLSEQLNPDSMTTDYDRYARDLGLIPSLFWRPDTPLVAAAAAATGPSSNTHLPHYMQLPSPDLSGPGNGDSAIPQVDLSCTLARNGEASQPSSTGRFTKYPPGLFLKRGRSECKFLGVSSIAVSLSTCLDLVAEAEGNTMQAQSLSHLVQGIKHLDEISLPDPSQSQQYGLPNIDLVDRGIKTYFETVHLRYPIVELDFAQTWRSQYEDRPAPQDPIQYSRLCLVTAIGLVSAWGLTSNYDTLENDIHHSLHQRVWPLISNIMACPYTDGVEIMLLHVIYLFYCGKSGIAWTTCGTAIRIAQSLGLHRTLPMELDFDEEQIRRRLRLWTAAYRLDAFLSMIEGRPPSTKEYPGEERMFILTQAECPPHLMAHPAPQIPRWHTQLAVITNRLCTLLSDEEVTVSRILEEIESLDQGLLQWRDKIPIDYRPDQENLANAQLYPIIAWLHIEYFNLLRSMHFVSFLASLQSPNMAHFGARIRSSESIALSAAQSVIKTLNKLSDGLHSNAVRATGAPVSYCLATVAVVFRKIIEQPHRVSARTELEYLRTGVLHIGALLIPDLPLQHFYALFQEMQRIAEDMVLRTSLIPP